MLSLPGNQHQIVARLLHQFSGLTGERWRAEPSQEEEECCVSEPQSFVSVDLAVLRSPAVASVEHSAHY